MNIEDLNKTQLLLLTLLVNFVTSIATGVLTVSLLSQAPATVVQTVNRIVDHTIETVTTQAPAAGAPSAAVPSSEDLLTSAIASLNARTVHLAGSHPATDEMSGLFIPSARAVFTYSNALPKNVNVTFPDGTVALATETTSDGPLRQFVFATDAALPKVANAKLVAEGDLKQGQTAIALDASGAAVTGIISKIDSAGIAADLPTIPAGGAAMGLAGAIIGISRGDGTFAPADRLTALEAAAQ